MNIVPFASVGSLVFGDSRKTCREKLDSPFATFEKTVGENETDSFDDSGLHIYYSNEGLLEFVEAFSPAEIAFRGIAFLGRDLESVISDISLLGFMPIKIDVGVKFENLGIALTAPDGVVEGVAAHRRGYYGS